MKNPIRLISLFLLLVFITLAIALQGCATSVEQVCADKPSNVARQNCYDDYQETQRRLNRARGFDRVIHPSQPRPRH